MDTLIILAVLAIHTSLILLGLSWVNNQVKKGNKDQQEIKTRLAWIKKRQKGEA